MTRPLDRVLDALDVERRNGSTAEAHCPAHEDKRASLSVTEDESGKVLLKCHADCDTSDVLAAAGLKWSDLFPDKKAQAEPKGRTIVDRYTYTDADGKTLFQVLRFEPKGFCQFTPGKGYGRKKYGVETTLYRLPKVIQAAQDRRTVFVVEGEKDVHTLERLGFTATTCPQGAGEWEDRYSAHLSGAHVVLIPDNDPQGRRHMEAVARSVWDAAEDVRLVELGDVPEKGDITDWAGRGHTAEELKDLVRNTEPLDGPPEDPSPERGAFWQCDDDEVTIDQPRIVDFLEAKGFAKTFEFDRETSTRIRRRGHILHRYPDEKIKDFVFRYARRQDDRRVLYALRKGANIYLSTKTYEALRPLQPVFQRDTKETAYLYYKNGFVEVTAERIQLHPYGNLRGFIWSDVIKERPFTLIEGFTDEDFAEAQFGRFLWNVAGRDDERLAALCTAIGYLLHAYKNPAVAKAITFVDEVLSDVPAGRTGKGVVGKALGHMTSSVRIDARNFRFDSQFAFQRITPGVTRIVEFSDASRHFPFERLFSVITDVLQVEQKNRDAVTVPFAEAPKFLISTNYVIEGIGGSHEDRIFEVEFSDHYNAHHKPIDDFGNLFFSGWDEAEWNWFDNVMLHCLQLYLRRGLHGYEHVNLEAKKLAQMTSPEFAEFMAPYEDDDGQVHDRVVPNGPETDALMLETYDKAELHEEFGMQYPDADLTQTVFTKYLKTYARLRGWDVEQKRTDGGRTRLIWFVTLE